MGTITFEMSDCPFLPHYLLSLALSASGAQLSLCSAHQAPLLIFWVGGLLLYELLIDHLSRFEVFFFDTL